jgi:hypothetical protein
MVVGSVQSGKTANYTGLICKALDADYKVVIVLAGIHSNLRAQTQLRIDEGVLGFDTQKGRQLNPNSQAIGVGRLPGERPVIHSLTSSAEDGDFSKARAGTTFFLGSDPVVLVVKKNSRLLGNLLSWVLHVAGKDNPATGKKIIRDVPLLLIDDEADNASIDTGQKKGAPGDADSVTAINGKIRELLSAFEKAAYVGYTATPFANIFVNPDAETQRHGDDIFPRSFIVNVKPPSNYVGPARVFGLGGDVDADIPAEDGLPIVRPIDDYTTSFPPKHTKDHSPSELPASLKRAIRCFILVCAARRGRGQIAKHNSMLVHVTRYTNVQEKVVSLLRDELLPLQRRIQFGDGDRAPTLRQELEELWQTEFAPTSAAMGDDAGVPVAWAQVEAELNAAATRTVVMTINGSAKEVLDYKNHEADGLSVIAVGGDKLSRGLTLEGLSVSYFLRTSRMYDTLMQMGRWFGYRQGYLDLCRLFTTRQLVHWYRHVALAEVELKREFDRMVATGRTPADYGLRVRTHPDGMIVTALNKMSHAETRNVSWGGMLVQTTSLPRDPARVTANFDATDAFLRSLGRPLPDASKDKIWTDVSAAAISEFLEQLRLPPEAARAGGGEVATFIRRQSQKAPPELTQWTVCLVSNSQPKRTATVGGFEGVGLTKRSPPEAPAPASDMFPLRNSNLISPADQSIDLRFLPFSKDALERAASRAAVADDVASLGAGPWQNLRELALDITKKRVRDDRLKQGDPKVPNGGVVRELRPKSHGLLLIYPLDPTDLATGPTPIIGVALSFPDSDTLQGVEYQVNRVWGAAMEEDATYED